MLNGLTFSVKRYLRSGNCFSFIKTFKIQLISLYQRDNLISSLYPELAEGGRLGGILKWLTDLRPEGRVRDKGNLTQPIFPLPLRGGRVRVGVIHRGGSRAAPTVPYPQGRGNFTGSILFSP